MSFLANMTGNKALTAHNKGDYEKALQLYEEAVQKGANNIRVLRGYSVLLIRMSKFDRALEILKKMEKLPGIHPKEKADVRVNYAIILSRKGHLDRAMEILEDEFRSLKNGTMYSIIGYLKIEQGNAEEALAFNKAALEYDDTDPVFLDNLGQTYYRLFGDKEEAKVYFDKAIALKPEAIDTNYFLALYDIEEGNKEKALQRLETAHKGFTSPLNYASPEMIEAKIQEIKA